MEAGKPFDAGFEFYEKRLTLLEIVRSRLPAAEFAFFSACHTAELTEGSSAEEGLHMAATVQYCGFRSVAGTMWAMANEDGPDEVLLSVDVPEETRRARRTGVVLQEICRCTSRRVAGAAKETEDEKDRPKEDPGAVGEFRSLPCMICECLGFVGCGLRAHCLRNNT